MSQATQIRKQASSLARQQYQNKHLAKQSNFSNAGEMLRQQFDNLAERFRSLPVEQQRIIAATAVGGGIGGAAGLAGALGRRNARRSVIGDTLRGALAGGVVGGGGAIGYNTLAGKNNPVTGKTPPEVPVPPVTPVTPAPASTQQGPAAPKQRVTPPKTWAEAVNLLDKVRSEGDQSELGQMLRQLDQRADPWTGAATGAGIMAAAELNPWTRANNRLAALGQYLSDEGASATPAVQSNLRRVHRYLQDNPKYINQVARGARREQLREMLPFRRPFTVNDDSPFYQWLNNRMGQTHTYTRRPLIRRPSIRRKLPQSLKWLNRLLGKKEIVSSSPAPLSPQGRFTGATLRRAMQPAPRLWFNRPSARIAAGGGLGAAATFAPGLLNQVLPTKPLTDEQARKALGLQGN